MYDDRGDELFGHDGRNKPPMADLLTMKGGWGGSHGRLAYSGINRQQDANMSEYAIKTIGMMPKGYVIINADTMDYDPETALRVGPHRVAVPVKELARDRRLTIQEQWELMNPRYIGTYFNFNFVVNLSRRPEFDEAYQDAIAKGETEEFLAQFWTPEYEHEAAIHRLRMRLINLEDRRMELKVRLTRAEGKVRSIKSDIAYQRTRLYENIQKALWKAEADLERATQDFKAHIEKIDKIKTYLKHYTI